MKNAYEITTLAEVKRMTDGGMKLISVAELEARLDELGYYVNKSFSFNYLNNLNGNSYLARSIAIFNKTSKKSFANVESHDDNLPALQEIRKNCFCFENGRIWEI
jgi:hypothetical protein